MPKPPVIPVQRPATFGFVDNAERWNGRASMVGWWSLLAEAVAGERVALTCSDLIRDTD